MFTAYIEAPQSAYMAPQEVERIVKVYGTNLLCAAFMYPNDHKRAEDVCQEVFIKYYRALKAFDSSEHDGAQLKNLNDVKRELAVLAHQHECNCIANFKYGQKSRWLAIDNVAFFGNGTAGRLTQMDYGKIAEYIMQRDNA